MDKKPFDECQKTRTLLYEEKAGRVFHLPSEKIMKSFIYVIAESKEGPCKIGFSTKPNSRIKELQTGNSRQLFVFSKKETRSSRHHEKYIKEQFLGVHIRGEWFGLNVEDASFLIEDLISNWTFRKHLSGTNKPSLLAKEKILSYVEGQEPKKETSHGPLV